ncbi:hypothetical protein PG987_014038 [Apiospora arundinis]
MACDKESQQTSVEDLQRRLTQLTMKADQAKSEAYKALNKKARGTDIFSKSPEACERDFMAELERMERMGKLRAKSQKPRKVPSETEFMAELERLEKSLAKSHQPMKVPIETEFMAELERVDKMLAKSQETKKAGDDIIIIFLEVLS